MHGSIYRAESRRRGFGEFGLGQYRIASAADVYKVKGAGEHETFTGTALAAPQELPPSNARQS